jgi:hypothetical protein
MEITFLIGKENFVNKKMTFYSTNTLISSKVFFLLDPNLEFIRLTFKIF